MGGDNGILAVGDRPVVKILREGRMSSGLKKRRL